MICVVNIVLDVDDAFQYLRIIIITSHMIQNYYGTTVGGDGVCVCVHEKGWAYILEQVGWLSY